MFNKVYATYAGLQEVLEGCTAFQDVGLGLVRVDALWYRPCWATWVVALPVVHAKQNLYGRKPHILAYASSDCDLCLMVFRCSQVVEG